MESKAFLDDFAELGVVMINFHEQMKQLDERSQKEGYILGLREVIRDTPPFIFDFDDIGNLKKEKKEKKYEDTFAHKLELLNKAFSALGREILKLLRRDKNG